MQLPGRSPPPMRLFSRRLSASERNYDIGNRELLAIKLALEEWRHWLEGATTPFIVWTDHHNLEYLRSAKRLNARQARWALFVDRFEFSLSYRPGSRNAKVDALSRSFPGGKEGRGPPPTILPSSVRVAALSWEIERQVEAASRDQPGPSNCPEGRLFVPESLRSSVLQWAHDSRLACHPGAARTSALGTSGAIPCGGGGGVLSRTGATCDRTTPPISGIAATCHSLMDSAISTPPAQTRLSVCPVMLFRSPVHDKPKSVKNRRCSRTACFSQPDRPQ
ncbi:uncharacterized protein ACBT44_010838 [Syngnathus typhle]